MSKEQKRFVEQQCRTMADAVSTIGRDVESYLEGSYGLRRQKAILNYLDRAEKEFRPFGLRSTMEAFVKNELLPFENYNHQDMDDDLKIGAALWMLEKIRSHGTMVEAYDFLPDVSEEPDAFYLPVDFSHPCYSNELIQSLIHVITDRYGARSRLITEENARGKRPSETWQKLLNLLPEEEVERACDVFKDKLWELAARYLKGQAYFDKLIAQNQNKLKMAASPLINPAMKEPEEEIDKRDEELRDREHDYAMNFDKLLHMDRRSIRRETGSREIAEALEGFTVDDPYELCFALLYLLDTGDDAPWLMKSGCSLMMYVITMLPWYVDRENWDDDDWDAFYDGLRYDQNDWVEKGPVEDHIDYYHTMHGDQNLAQVIYGLSRGVVPTGLHPFEEDRKRLIEEGMNEDVARKVTETAELMFLQTFQARQVNYGDWDRPVFLEEEELPAESMQRKGTGDKITFDKAVPVSLGGYWGKVIGEQGKSVAAETPDKLQAELSAAKKRIKSLGNELARTRQEANNERAKLEHELKALRLEHRELADLRELVFNREVENSERLERVEKEYSYPYETKKRTVIFGGHDTWLKAIRPMLPNVKYVDAGNLAFNTDIVKNADVVWIQNNCISHTQYWNVVKNCKIAGVQMRYFGFASAEKCAEQLVTEDQK